MSCGISAFDAPEFGSKRVVAAPLEEAASAAETPAIPPPTTTTLIEPSIRKHRYNVPTGAR
jgi:hypothetical protein